MKSIIENTNYEYFVKIVIINLVLMLLFMLRSAGYFNPIFLISVNFIVFAAIIMSILLLKFRRQKILTISLVFFVFAGLLKIIAYEIWAERTMVYAYQALTLGIILMFIEKNKS